MPITVQDIQLMQSERLTDDPDGGGEMSATEIVNGDLNNLFSDRSQLDSLYGRISLRKAFPRVNTLTQDTYFGAFGFVSDPPDDGKVDTLVFTTGSYTDERTAARSYIENYRIRSVIAPYTLYGDHFVGSRTLQVYCREEAPTPDIGEVFCLRTEAVGYPIEEQYMAVEEVLSRTTQTFTDSGGDFQRDVIVMALTTAMSVNFYGMDPPRRNSDQVPPTKIRFTQVSDQTAYFGVKVLEVDASEGDLQIKIPSPYVSLVPASRAETPISDVRAGLGTVALVKCSETGALSIASFAGSADSGESLSRYFGNPYTRRSLSISVAGVMLRDDGHGGIEPVSPLDTGWSGFADYEDGKVTIIKNAAWSAAVSMTATAAGPVPEQGFSEEIPITPANRQLSYVHQLPNFPAVGTVNIQYRALGKWITLYDRGNGQLSGNSSGEGTGNANYNTGSLTFTLGALPDLDSSIIIAWGVDIRARDSHGDITVGNRRYVQQMAHGSILPITFGFTWTSGGAPKTATCDISGIISGDADGELDYVAGIARFYTTVAPDPGEQYHYAYDHSPLKTEVYPSLTVGGTGQVTFTVPEAIEPGSFKAQWVMRRASPYGWSNPSLLLPAYAFDDGVGGFIGSTVLVTDTIDYGTGDAVLTVEQERITWIPQYAFRKNTTTGGICAYITGYDLGNVGFELDGSPLRIEYMKAGDAITSVTESHDPPPIQFQLSQNAAGPAVPSSLRFTYRGLTYFDRSGFLYHTLNPVTGAGTLAGSYDYSTNTATLTAYGASGNTVAVIAMLTRYVDPGVTAFFFRTPGSPLKAGSFVVRATTLDGEMLVGSADINGNITGDQMKGKVDWETGVVRLNFGAMATAAGNESEPWYDPDFVSGGLIWKPEQVDPSTVFIGTVVYKPIPMNPDVLGLDPVRLPSDGRVLAFRIGDIAVVHNTKTNTITSPVAGSTYSMGRDRLSFLELRDSNGVAVNSVWYTSDLTDGSITFADPLNLSAYTGPFEARHRVEDASRITDVEITGQIQLESELTHDYTDGDSYVSSCLIYGDMRARYTNIFDQQTWAGVWSDTLQGSAATGTYNDQFFPIEITNRGAVTERWAVIFKSTNTVDIVGEETGVILTSVSILSDIAPINPITMTDEDPDGFPYFVLKAAGFGAGWSLNNVIRFNTVSATRPTWFARCTRPGPIEVPNDSFRFQIYGDATV